MADGSGGGEVEVLLPQRRTPLYQQLEALYQVARRDMCGASSTMTSVPLSIFIIAMGGPAWMILVVLMSAVCCIGYYICRQVLVWPMNAFLRFLGWSSETSCLVISLAMLSASFAAIHAALDRTTDALSSTEEDSDSLEHMFEQLISGNVDPTNAEGIGAEIETETEASGQLGKKLPQQLGKKLLKACMKARDDWMRLLQPRMFISIWVWMTVPLVRSLIPALGKASEEGRGSYEALLAVSLVAWILLPARVTMNELVTDTWKACFSDESCVERPNKHAVINSKTNLSFDWLGNLIIPSESRGGVDWCFVLNQPAIFITGDGHAQEPTQARAKAAQVDGQEELAQDPGKQADLDRHLAVVRRIQAVEAEGKREMTVDTTEVWDTMTWSHEMVVKEGMEIMVGILVSAPEAQGGGRTVNLRRFNVQKKASRRAQEIAKSIVGAISGIVVRIALLAFGLAHVMLPYWCRMAMQQDPPCIIPLPATCKAPCINDILSGYVISENNTRNHAEGERVIVEALFSNTTVSGLPSGAFHAVSADLSSPWATSPMALYEGFTWFFGISSDWPFLFTGPNWSCLGFPLVGVVAVSVLAGVLAVHFYLVTRSLSRSARQLEELNDLLLVYQFAAPEPNGATAGTATDTAQLNHFRVHQWQLLRKLHLLRGQISDSTICQYYWLDVFPLFYEGQAPMDAATRQDTDFVTHGLVWWFQTRCALMALMEKEFQTALPLIAAVALLVFALIVATIYRGVTTGLEFPLTAYAVLDGLVFGVVMLLLILAGSDVNAGIDEGAKLAGEVAKSFPDDALMIDSVLRYYESRPYYLYLFGFKIDRKFVGTYSGSIGAYGLVIFVNFFKSYFAPFLKELE